MWGPFIATVQQGAWCQVKCHYELSANSYSVGTMGQSGCIASLVGGGLCAIQVPGMSACAGYTLQTLGQIQRNASSTNACCPPRPEEWGGVCLRHHSRRSRVNLPLTNTCPWQARPGHAMGACLVLCLAAFLEHIRSVRGVLQIA
jgi:hypothetical protein